MKRYVVYLRVSTKDQGRSGLGLEAQKRDIGLFLDTYSEEPYQVIGEFLEIESGTDSGRPELAKALDMVRRHKGSELLVSKLDRLSRRVAFIATLMEDPKVQFRVASMPHADKFSLHVYAALAEQERDFISTRTKAALAAAKARGVSLGGLRDTTMKRNAVRASQAAQDAERLAGLVLPLRDAGKSLREIAASLNDSGIRTARGSRWEAVTVKRVLDRLTN